MLQFENLRGLGAENFTTLLPGVLMGVAGGAGWLRRWYCTVDSAGALLLLSSLLLLGRRPGLGRFLQMVDMCLDVVNVSEDRPPVRGQLF